MQWLHKKGGKNWNKKKNIFEYEFDKTDGKPAWLLLLDKLNHIESVVLLLFFFFFSSAFAVVLSWGLKPVTSEISIYFTNLLED